MSLLHARNVVVAYGARKVLDGVTLSLQKGEVVGLIGPNGAGKTTLLRVLAGLLSPRKGEVLMNDRPLSQVPRRARARHTAYLAQSGASHWAVDVATLVGLGRLPHLAPWQGPTAHDRAAVDAALAACDVTHLVQRPLNHLSGGERARVMLARALAVEPAVLLADEPVAGLDPAHALDVMAVLCARAASGTGIIAVMHDLTTAARHCDRLILLAEGRVLAAGTPDEVLDDAHLAAAYGIRVHRSEADGQPFVVPIARVTPGTRP